jgi:hypothetical protein
MSWPHFLLAIISEIDLGQVEKKGGDFEEVGRREEVMALAVGGD